MVNKTSIVEEIDKVIDFIKRALVEEVDEDKFFELCVLKYVLVKCKREEQYKSSIHFGYGDHLDLVYYLLSENNIEILKKLGWTVLSRYQVIYTDRMEAQEFLLIPPGEELPDILSEEEANEKDNYELFFEKWRVVE